MFVIISGFMDIGVQLKFQIYHYNIYVKYDKYMLSLRETPQRLLPKNYVVKGKEGKETGRTKSIKLSPKPHHGERHDTLGTKTPQGPTSQSNVSRQLTTASFHVVFIDRNQLTETRL